MDLRSLLNYCEWLDHTDEVGDIHKKKFSLNTGNTLKNINGISVYTSEDDTNMLLQYENGNYQYVESLDEALDVLKEYVQNYIADAQSNLTMAQDLQCLINTIERDINEGTSPQRSRF